MKNRTLIYFITGSLLLLGLLEFLWLQKSYNEQRSDLQQLIQQNLRTVVGQESNAMMLGALRSNPALDSLFRGGMLRLPFAPTPRSNNLPSVDSITRVVVHRKTPSGARSVEIFMDTSTKKRIEFRQQIQLSTKQIEPLKGGGRNDIQLILGSDTSAFSTFLPTDSAFKMPKSGNFVYSAWNEDSINLDRISTALSALFAKSGLPELPFKLSKIKRSDVVPTEKTAIVATARIFDAPHSHNKIGIAVYDFEPFLLRKMGMEAAFALFVFGVTSGSFWLVYRNFLQQKQLTALKNSFISNITHELKTPIATVSVALEALQNFGALNNPELTKEYLDISRGELNRLSMLVDKVLKLAIFDEKEPELQVETVNLPDLVQRVADSLRLQFEKNGAVFHLHNPQNADLNIEADPTHLTSVVYNLLDNALKYGGKKIEVTLELANPNGQNTDLSSQNTEGVVSNIEGVNFQVSDDGKGIAEEFKDKIFDKFFRVPTEDIHNTKGHGLGLSYVAAVVRLHGGSISVNSEENIGTQFNVFLPKG
jgi:two-component system, OmpR family, phosphate regulon sensor histidine kinase PhoR